MKLMKVTLLLTLAIAVMASSQDQQTVFKAVEDLDELPKEKLAEMHKKAEKFEFQAEVNRMMKLIIHSLYKSKEIFLRELISNASDALDKIRLLSLTDSKILGRTDQLNITIKADPDRGVLIITDTGVGMTKDELVKNLGTIAKSGTNEFLQAMENKNKADSHLIGQFGVGFYSAFLVADRVTVASKHNDDQQYVWESNAESDFTVAVDPRGNTLGRGTQIVLHLKEEADRYLEESRLEEIIRKYSEFINFPIYLQMNKTETVEVPLSEAELEKAKEKARIQREIKKQKKRSDDFEFGDDEGKSETDEEDQEAQVENVDEDLEEDEDLPTTKEVEQSYFDWVLMNPNKPIWTRDPKDVSEAEYNEFYHSFGKDETDPMSYTHFKAEGDADFKAMLFIPSKAPANHLQDPNLHIKSVKLFVRRVFITDELLDFMPKYLGFLKGLVDSDDLPLNVSRETLQKHRLLRMIKKKVVSKALELIRKLSADEDKYEEFLKEYGTSLKLGAIEDSKNRKSIVRLLRFYSSNDPDKRTSLEGYVGRMKKGQNQIFFLTGASLAEIKSSPFVERIIARGYEVLFLDEPIDEYLIQNINDYDRKPFQNVAKEGLKFGDETDEQQDKLEAMNTEFKPLADYFSSVLGKGIEKVVVSSRLTTSPCAIVASQHGWSGNFEKLMSSQALASGNEDALRQFQATQKKTLEINPKHPLIRSLLHKVNGEEQDATTEELIHVLYETTAIRSGYVVKDTVDFATRIERVLRANLGVDLDAQAVVDDIEPAPEHESSKDAPEDDADSGFGSEFDEVNAVGGDEDDDYDHEEL